MKVLLINGSPHEKGCTYTALSLIAKELNDAGVDTEILHVGGKPVGGCIGCGGCAAGNGCVFGGVVNEAIEKAKTADGFVFGSPVQELGRNMAWLLHCIEAGRAAGFEHPQNPKRPMTNFIR